MQGRSLRSKNMYVRSTRCICMEGVLVWSVPNCLPFRYFRCCSCPHRFPNHLPFPIFPRSSTLPGLMGGATLGGRQSGSELSVSSELRPTPTDSECFYIKKQPFNVLSPSYLITKSFLSWEGIFGNIIIRFAIAREFLHFMKTTKRTTISLFTRKK